MAEDGYRVTLNMYDLSQGLARQYSMMLLGKVIEAVWHTGIVVYGNEYFFGGGIQCCPAGRTQYGTPLRTVDLGVTHVPKEVFEVYLQEIHHRYTEQTYNLLSHNCNNFSDEVAQFLVGSHIPNYILNLPNEVLNSSMGALLMPTIQNIEKTMRQNDVPQIPQFISPLPPAAAAALPSAPKTFTLSTTEACKAKVEEAETRATQDMAKPVGVSQDKKEAVANNPMGDARRKVQEEITKEFAAIMASSTLRASEAAALATRRVMEKHGHLTSPMK